ncbi:MAG: methionine--tRNA ligase [Candidatus Puniceispirillaceae bacterium]
MKNSFYITTPIYYVNDKPHIGHAYTTLACDVMARFQRLDGKDVKFLTGTDEHGQKVEAAATKAGIDPQSFTDTVSQNFQDLAVRMNYSHDEFIRTTSERHKKTCQKLWNILLEKGHIYLGKYAGWYSVRDEAYYTETEIVDGKAPTGAPVEWVEEPSYFFDLSKWEDKLLAYYDANPDFVAPQSRYNEIKSFVSGGLKDLSVSRTSFQWGVPVPGDDKHVMYVWLDALTNYLTAAGWGDDEASYQALWPADIHMVGKDILRFHAVYWPAFLMAADLPLPQRVYAHGWWTNEGQKISKSLGNVIDPHALVDEFGLDQTRYFLMREVPFGRDGDFARSAIIQRINSDLANDLGNLSNRVQSLIVKNLDGILPAVPEIMTDDDKALLDSCDSLLEQVRAAILAQQFHDALRLIWDVISQSNRYIDTQAPWALKKTDPARMAEVLAILMEAIRQVAILVQPIMPQSAAALLDQLHVSESDRGFTMLGGVRRTDLPVTITKPQGIFPRFIEAEEGA